jgi:hypothetical protein
MNLSKASSRFARQIKRLAKLHPASAASKKLRPLAEVELMKIVASGGKRAAEKAVKGVKLGAHRLQVAEKKGDLIKWRNRIAIGMQIVEVAILASAAIKGASVRVTPAQARKAPAKRGHTRKAKRSK